MPDKNYNILKLYLHKIELNREACLAQHLVAASGCASSAGCVIFKV